jgi:hypothetical protein
MEVRGQAGSYLVATYKALGGGWQIRKSQGILSEENRNEMIQRTDWGGLLGAEDTVLPVADKNQKDWQRPDW